MSNKTLTMLSILMLVCIGALIVVQYLPFVWTVETETYATYNGTKGSSIRYDNKPWTLNFDQQNSLIAALNEGESVVPGLVKKDPSLFKFDRVTIYQFDKPDPVFIPVALIGNNIVFEAPKITETGFLQEGSNGKLMQILSESFDS